MPRVKKLSREQAIEKAIYAFWQYGYDLSVRDLERTTGINRFMLQTEFGGKEGLFLCALDAYLENGKTRMFDPISNGDLDTIATIFLKRCSENLNPNAKYGCLAINTVLDENATSLEIEKRRKHFLKLSHDSYKNAIENERKNGRIIEELDSEQAANFLTVSIIGINMVIKVNKRSTAAEPAAKMIIQQIMSWRK